MSENLSPDDLSTKLLCQVNGDDVCDSIFAEPVPSGEANISFTEWINYLADTYEKDIKIDPTISTACGDCEFIAEKDGITGFYQSRTAG